MADASYTPKVYREQGGSRQVIASGGSLDIESGGEIDIESGAAFKSAGTDIASSLAQLNGVSATAAEHDEYTVNVLIPDVSTGQSVWVVAPHAGNITKIYTVLYGAISVADATITAEIGGTLVTGSSITIAQASSAAGDVDSSSPSAANAVTAGQAIEIITDGGSTTAAAANVSILISR